ncbi:MAG: response regulator transcription factor [Mailhella sp.]|nr:response regulator transcription factor [Mailhella sp.]
MLSSLKKQLSVPSIHLLVASPDAQALKNIFSYLESMGYQLDSASDSDGVYNCLRDASYDALILDAQLSDANGIPLYTCLRLQHFSKPIILLVPDAGMENLPRYLNSGADDIVTAPLHLLELEARILAGIRLSKAHMAVPLLSWAGIDMDLRTHSVSCDGKPLHLPPMAFLLLAKLMKAAPGVVSRAELQKELYGDNPPNSDALRTYIHHLRSKLEKAGKPILHTVPRVGFRLNEE